MVGGADFPQNRCTHELKEAEAGLAVFCTLKFLVRIRQNFVPGVSDRPVALDIGVDQPVQLSIVLFQLFQIAIGLVAGKNRREHKGSMAQKIVLHVRLVGNFILSVCKDFLNQFFL